jgi:hypothetical protein
MAIAYIPLDRYAAREESLPQILEGIDSSNAEYVVPMASFLVCACMRGRHFGGHQWANLAVFPAPACNSTAAYCRPVNRACVWALACHESDKCQAGAGGVSMLEGAGMLTAYYYIVDRSRQPTSDDSSAGCGRARDAASPC